MNSELPPEEADLSKHQTSFEQQPAKTKELELLSDQAEKTTGQEKALLHQMVQAKSRELPCGPLP